MKKIITTYIFLLLSVVFVNAQTLNFEFEEVEGAGTIDMASIDVHNYLTLADATKSLDLNWVYATYDFPEEWTFAMCTDDACWATQESVLPVELSPDGVIDTKMQFKPNGVEGTGYATLTFTDAVDPTISATTTFMATADPTTGITLTQVEPKFNFYPNPVVDVMNIELEHYPEVEKIAIYNLVGKEVKSLNTADNQDIIDTSDLIQGMYLIVLEDLNGNLLETRRFSKIY